MYLTYSIYAILIALFIWGCKFAGFKNANLHEDSSSLDSMKSLRGYAAIGVILHHISQEEAFQWAGGGNGKPGELSIFVNAGYLFVAIFFFCSGFGLIKSLKNKPDYFNGFMKKRVVKTLVIPYYVSILLYAAARLANGDKLPPVQWITNFIGISMMNTYAWYPIIAAILYTAFYLIFKNIKNRRSCFCLMALVILILGMIFCVNGHFAWWAGPENWWLTEAGQSQAKWWMMQGVWWISGEWWINSCPALLAGMLFAYFEEGIRGWFKKLYWLKLVLVILVTILASFLAGFGQYKFGWWSEFNGNGPAIGNKIATYFLVIPYSIMFAILIYTVMLKFKASNPVSRFFGKLSLETYMMNLLALTALRFLLYKPDFRGRYMPFYKAGNYNLAIYLAAVFALTILLALLYKLLNSLVQKLIK